MKKNIILIIVVLLLIASPVQAEMYKYVDKNGAVVITDDMNKIPDDQRSKIQRAEEYGNRNDRRTEKQTKKQTEDSFASEPENRSEKGNAKFQDMMEKQYGIKFKEPCSTETKIEIKNTLESVWQGMTQRLAAGDLESALSFFSVFTRESSKRKLSGFSKEQLDVYLKNVRSLEIESLQENNRIANCGLIRDEKGRTFSYPIRFVKDPDCVWRISSF